MSDDEFADFTEQMRLLVAEGSFLWELPAGTRDHIGENKWLDHGPWQQADCAAAVHLWFDAGLLSVLRRWPEEHALTAPDAREVLDALDSWLLEQDGTNFALEETEAGAALGWDEWRTLLRVLRSG